MGELGGALPYVVIANAALVALVLVVVAAIVGRRLREVPGPLQNAIERGLEWFVGQARAIRADAVTAIVPFLASLFAFILACNLLIVVPVPLLRVAPTTYYGATLALALTAVGGVVVLGVRLHGLAATARHLVWPNPLQLVSEVSHVLSLSLRLFGNMGGELLVAVLVTAAVPYGLPLVIHALGLVPAVVQPLVFTLLVSNFLGEAVHQEPARQPASEPAPEAP
ncbi:MAG TPA: FoF1 ATP synthase subunit a [Kofleriaceae bacterium]|nr:FoF1 ATP synthase subunit a [Kofleriaceae bacterium]